MNDYWHPSWWIVQRYDEPQFAYLYRDREMVELRANVCRVIWGLQ